MSTHRYPVRIFEQGLMMGSDYEEPDALSSPGRRVSSPASEFEANQIIDGIPFQDLQELSTSDESDSDFAPSPDGGIRRRPALSDVEKTKQVLGFMSDNLSRFSLRIFLVTAFTSDDPIIKNWVNVFLADDCHLQLMELWWKKRGGLKAKQGQTPTTDWVMRKAAEICNKEASWLTDRASEGPFVEDAKFLRLKSANVTVEKINEFRIFDLLCRYERITPNLQAILKSVIAKEKKDLKPGSRDPDSGRTLATSMLLNLRSRKTNYHPVMNSLIFWDGRVSKRLNQAFNNFGVTTSFPSQARAITALSKDAVLQARKAANDPSKILMLPYDNFNWTSHAWETSASHGSRTHDEVSALLVALPIPEGGSSASEITRISLFEERAGHRHKIPPAKSLVDIMPSKSDHLEFRRLAILHVAVMLCEEIKDIHHLSKYAAGLFEDASQAKPQRTEEYYLPTFDQEQGSTRGNMVVLEHYFRDVLKIPKETFEQKMFTILGDRLTTARDRAAQDQRAVDRSKYRFDHLSSFAMISGLMHFCLNFIQAIGGNAWGENGKQDSVSLLTLRDILPNRSEIQLRKVDYYAWLRFLEVVLKSLTLRSSKLLLEGLPSHDFSKYDEAKLIQHATSIVDAFIVQSPARLEAAGKKIVQGSTECGHAILLFRDLMTLREMQHSIKFGHPERILRMIKFWMPMFYAAGSYNYANECMELLHNLIHDWPSEYAGIALKGMLVNPQGKEEGNKPTDIRVEHLNDRIKERAHGSNATPEVLEKVTPAMGHVQTLTDQLFEDLGVEKQNQAHSHVLQHKDVELLTEHLSKKGIFDFTKDQKSPVIFLDLFAVGSQRLSGGKGGHANHLARHKQRLRTRHGNEEIEQSVPDEIEISRDTAIEYSLADSERINELNEIVRMAEADIEDDD